MKIHWLEQTEADVPQDLAWLGATELEQLSTMRFAKRRGDWQLGRWTAKHAVAACLHLPADFPSLAKIEVRQAASGAPEVFVASKPAPVTISVSHSAGIGACAVALSYGALGCDVEMIEPRSDAFADDYFTTEEQQLVAQATEDDRPLVLTLLWSAKESALKALRAGLRLDTRCVIVTPEGLLRDQKEDVRVNVRDERANLPDFPARQANAANGWRPLRVRHTEGTTFHGWWQHTPNLVRTLVAAPLPAPPVLLNIPPK